MTESELTPDLVEFVKNMKDRNEIMECLHRYTRGVDRGDLELMKSAYHPDALDEHGVASGGPEDFCSWAIGYHATHQVQHHHILTNTTLDIEGGIAHGETYYMFWADNREGPATLSFGRYIDRFEKREDRWAIAHRVCLNQQTTALCDIEMPDEFMEMVRSTGPSSRDKNDLSYDRPLTTSHGN